MMKNIFWSGYCSHERITSIARLEDEINKIGFIVDFKQFSDISIAIQIEIEEQYLKSLYQNLNQILLIDEIRLIDTDSNIEINLFLHVHFTNGSGNLRIEVPAVPG